MAYAVNTSGRVVPVRSGDAVGIRVDDGSLGIQRLTLNLSARSSDVHCLVALPLLPASPWTDARVPVWLRMQVQYIEAAARDRTPFMLFVVSYRDGQQIGEERMRFFAGEEPAWIVLQLPHEAAEHRQVVIYADRSFRGTLVISEPRLIAGLSEYGIGARPDSRQVDLGRNWVQDGNRVVCRSYFGEHWAEMPDGWTLDGVHPSALAAAEWILYAKAYQRVFGLIERAPDPEDASRRHIGDRVLLSYSLGTDSTAAMTLLHDDVDRYYCRRPYASYLTAAGARIALPDIALWEGRLAGLSNTTVVSNTFEQLRIAAGASHGYDHNFGYAAIGLLLADHAQAGALAFGSVMEQVFLRSGNLFADVVAIPSSSYNTFRRLTEGAGLFFALPTGGCSEVLTSRIADAGRYRGLAISCPQPAPDGTPCGTCFKCFRKLRLDGSGSVPDPGPGVLKLLEKYPLKSATSVVYAAQRSGYRHPALEPYLHLDLGFLDRYFGYAVDRMLPPDLARTVHAQFASLGIKPMTAADEEALRTVGRTFWPEQFDWARAGLPDPGVAQPRPS